MQCSAVQCSAVQCSAVQCSAMQCNASHQWTMLFVHERCPRINFIHHVCLCIADRHKEQHRAAGGWPRGSSEPCRPGAWPHKGRLDLHRPRGGGHEEGNSETCQRKCSKCAWNSQNLVRVVWQKIIFLFKSVYLQQCGRTSPSCQCHFVAFCHLFKPLTSDLMLVSTWLPVVRCVVGRGSVLWFKS